MKAANVKIHSLVSQLPFTNYAYEAVNKNGEITASELIDLARFYAAQGYYIESLSYKRASRPVLTRKMPSQCNFLRYYDEKEFKDFARVTETYSSVVMCDKAI